MNLGTSGLTCLICNPSNGFLVLNSSKIENFISFLTVFIQFCSDMAYPSELVIWISWIFLIIYTFLRFFVFFYDITRFLRYFS